MEVSVGSASEMLFSLLRHVAICAPLLPRLKPWGFAAALVFSMLSELLIRAGMTSVLVALSAIWQLDVEFWKSALTISVSLGLAFNGLYSSSVPEHPFQYSDLTGTRQIRLLRVDPRVPGDAWVECELVAVDLDDDSCPEFEALSYRWAGQKPSKEISLNGKRFLVTENVHAFLEDISGAEYLSRTGGQRTIWIDSICINQGDIHEKNIQLPLMGTIYRKAKRVIAWLGRSPDADRALKLILDLHHPKLDFPELYTKCLRLRGSPEWEAMLKLLANQWATRQWMVQEVALANAHLTLQYGRQWIYFDYFLSIARMFTNSAFSVFVMNTDDYRMRRCDFSSLANLVQMSLLRDQIRAGNSPSLGQALVACCRFECEDPRDKVYGLLGLTSHEGPHRIIPNYGKGVEEIYQDVSRSIMLGEKYTILPFAGIGVERQLKSLSSWVVDWSPGAKKLQPITRDNIPYRASLGSEAEFRFAASSPAEVSIKGALVDVIKEQGSIMPLHPGTSFATPNDLIDVSEAQECMRTWFRWFAEARQLAVSARPRGHDSGDEGREIAFWRTVMADVDGHGSRPAMVESVLECRNAVRTMQSATQAINLSDEDFAAVMRTGLESESAVPNDSSAPAELFGAFKYLSGGLLEEMQSLDQRLRALKKQGEGGDLVALEAERRDIKAKFNTLFDGSGFVPSKTEKMSQSIRQINESMKPLCISEGRRFCITEGGHMGLIPPLAELGDVVSIILGAATPYLLRPMNDGTYKLVGECYFYGMMDGEMLLQGYRAEWLRLV